MPKIKNLRKFRKIENLKKNVMKIKNPWKNLKKNI
jgi:hypothetical protein